MEVQTYESIIEKMNNLGQISVRNIDEYVSLSNELIENLEKINQIDVELLVNNKDIDNYNEILSQVNTYKQNKKYIKRLNEYLVNKQDELSYTLQYQRLRKLSLIHKKKSIYSNK